MVTNTTTSVTVNPGVWERRTHHEAAWTRQGRQLSPDDNLHTLGILKAENLGTATITVKGLAPEARSLRFPNASNQWSGYVVPGGPFASAVGQWTIPEVFSDAGEYSATWVGIDGVGSNKDNHRVESESRKGQF